MNSSKEDIGVMKDFVFDLAFGTDENDFECEINKDKHCCENGFFLYIEGTEYGGIIDKIQVNTENETVIYKGRTWHGILEKKILEPDSGEDYLILSGDANDVLAEIIDRIGMNDLFTVETEESGIEIVSFKVERYADAYSTIRKMLFEATGKLHIEFKDQHVKLSCVPYIDFSQDEEWDSSQLEFKIEKDFRPVNHLVCLGQGDLKKRHVIHLFTDENGGIQPYAIKDVPLQDSDYILDKSNQVMFGSDEVCEVYDLSNAGSTENYLILSKQPAKWARNYGLYYSQDEDGGYKALTSSIEETYTVQTSQPSNWAKKYASYYFKNGTEYESVEGVSTTTYKKQTKKPSDWSKNYGSYFDYWSDGTTSEYRSVSGSSKYKYSIQTKKPSDWSTNFSSYYKKKKKSSGYTSVEGTEKKKYTKLTSKPSDWSSNYNKYYYKFSDGVTTAYYTVQSRTKYEYTIQTQKPSDWATNYKNYYIKKSGKYVKLEGSKAPTWKTSTYYTRSSHSAAPTWVSNKYYKCDITITAPKWKSKKYYTRKSISVAPKWGLKNRYTKVVKTSAPTWVSNKYYTLTTVEIIPVWIPNAYFKKVIDNFEELVAGGIERLNESLNCDSLEINLDPEEEYDIGDVVGASEQMTGMETWQQITKKIVTIRNNEINISYKVGE